MQIGGVVAGQLRKTEHAERGEAHEVVIGGVLVIERAIDDMRDAGDLAELVHHFARRILDGEHVVRADHAAPTLNKASGMFGIALLTSLVGGRPRRLLRDVGCETFGLRLMVD